MRIALLLALLSCLSAVRGQVMVMPKDFNHNAKVKLVDEFFERFNGQEITPYIDRSRADYRKLNLLSLFNIGMFKSRQDTLYLKADTLMDVILTDGVRIAYADSLWFARARCRAVVDGHKTDITLWLSVEPRGDGMFKWVIARAEGKALELAAPATAHETMLLPTDHETNFISLHRMTSDTPHQALNFARKDFSPDPTTVFFALVYAGKLKIESVSDLSFRFLQVPGYEFYIHYFERDKANCGWLISSFAHMSEREKQLFIQKMHE